MAQDTYTILLRGYDVVIENAEDEDAYKVTVREGAGLGWDIVLPVNLDDFEGENEELDGSDALMQYLGNAAVDLYEAQQGRLGEGAAIHEEASMRRSAYYDSMQWEDWFMGLKGTPFEEQAYQMLQQYVSLGTEDSFNNENLSRLYVEEEQIKHDLDLMNLERMKRAPAETVIIIQGSMKSGCGFMSDEIEMFLTRFVGDQDEARAISKVRELLDVRDKINQASGGSGWKERESLEGKMHDLALQALQQNVKTPTGMEGAPNMASDIEKLMEGIDLNTPLEMSAGKQADLGPQAGIKMSGLAADVSNALNAYYNALAESGSGSSDPGFMSEIESEIGKWAQYSDLHYQGYETPTQAQKAARSAFSETEPVEDRVREKGEQREFLDPACVPVEDLLKFQLGDSVSTNKKLEIAGPGWGETTTIPSGSKGVIETTTDGHGDCFYVRLEDGRLIKVSVDDLSK